MNIPSAADWPRTRPVPITAPLHWLGRGFADLLAAPIASLFYGVLLALMGFLLTRYYGGAVGLALTTGFLLIGPFLAIGLYDISRQLEHGAHARLRPSLTAWQANGPAIGFYALILMLSLAVWLRVSVVLVALFIPAGVESLMELLSALLERPDAWMFALAYSSVGAVLAAFSFASSAVALPLLLDRTSTDAISAMIVSFSVIRANPGPMLLWAMLIGALSVAGFVTWFVGLAFTVPLIGHATWHAYRDCVEPERAGAA